MKRIANILTLTFFLSLLVCTGYTQLPTYGDCLGALPICDSIYIEMISPNDAGNFDDELHEDCCIQLEQNSIWYKFRIKQSGSLGFKIIPDDDTYDYDWSLFNITNKQCSDIADDFTLIASCNATGGLTPDETDDCYGETGPDGSTDFFFQNKNCGIFPPTFESDGFNPFNDFIDVVEGEYYALLILEFTPSVTEGFTIDFTYADDVGIYDEDRPSVSEITVNYDNCEIIGFTVEFDEEIVCNSFNFNDMNIIIFAEDGSFFAPDGIITSQTCNTGEISTTFDIVFDEPVAQGDVLSVSSNNDPYDPCINPIFEFQFNAFSPAEFDTIFETVISICDETVVIEEDLLGVYSSILWSTNETTLSIEVNPGFYEATLVGDCGQRTVYYTVENAVPDIELFVPNAICDDLAFIEITAFENYTYTLNDVQYESLEDIPGLEVGSYEMLISSEFCDTTILFAVEPISLDLSITGQSEYSILIGDSVMLDIDVIGDFGELFWIDNGENVCLGCFEYEVSPTVTTEYFIQAIDVNGCLVTYSILVRVDNKYDIYSPNIFSPNEDGINDRFLVFGNEALESINLLEIYDRWGERVYQGIDLVPNDSNEGWDGDFKNAKAAPGVYAWIANVKFIDGVEKSIYGSITLIR